MLQFEGKGNGYLRDPKRSYLPQPFDVEVPRWLIDKLHLQPGLHVKGLAATRNVKRVLQRIDQLEGADPIAVARRTHFQNLTATDPTERLVIETQADAQSPTVEDKPTTRKRVARKTAQAIPDLGEEPKKGPHLCGPFCFPAALRVRPRTRRRSSRRRRRAGARR